MKPDAKLMAAIMAAINAYIQTERASSSQNPATSANPVKSPDNK